MEPVRSTVRRSPRLTEVRLLGMLCRFCPEEGAMTASLIHEREEVFRAVGLLCMLYRFQDRGIHQQARARDPELRMTFAEREEFWIAQGGPAKFFARVDSALQRHYPEIFDPELLQAAWEFFQILATGVHIAYLARVTGRTPVHAEYLNSDLTAWYTRLAQRFEPLRPLPKQKTLH